MFSVIKPPPLHEEKEHQITNVSENASSLCPISTFVDHCAEIKFEGQF